MLRVNLFMMLPLGSGGCLMDPEARRRCGERTSPQVVSDRVIQRLVRNRARSPGWLSLSLRWRAVTEEGGCHSLQILLE
jgi:hypothetical protein